VRPARICTCVLGICIHLVFVLMCLLVPIIRYFSASHMFTSYMDLLSARGEREIPSGETVRIFPDPKFEPNSPMCVRACQQHNESVRSVGAISCMMIYETIIYSIFFDSKSVQNVTRTTQADTITAKHARCIQQLHAAKQSPAEPESFAQRRQHEEGLRKCGARSHASSGCLYGDSRSP
jgi:hypothetical protein